MSDSPATRASLLLRVRNPKDVAAWAEFDAIYRPLLMKFCSSSRLAHADAEDLVQHCMAAIHRHTESFEYDPKKGRFKGWLRTLVNNKIRDLYRRKNHEQAKTENFEREQEREPLPEDVFEKLWMNEHLKHALQLVRQEVEESSFAAYRRYAIDGQSVKQVCQELNLNPNQLYAIKFRLTRKIHELMKELSDGMQA